MLYWRTRYIATPGNWAIPFSILGRVVLTIYSLSPPNPGQAIFRMPVVFNTNVIRSVLASCLLLAPLVAEAYIGPGAGISFLQGLWVALVGLVLSIVAIILLPIKLLWRTFGAAKFVLLLAGLGALLWFVSGQEPRAIPDRVSARVIVLGFDGLDPELAEQWMNEGLMPNFAGPIRASTVFSIFSGVRRMLTRPIFRSPRPRQQITASIFSA